jgi:hypothetical protein
VRADAHSSLIVDSRDGVLRKCRAMRALLAASVSRTSVEMSVRVVESNIDGRSRVVYRSCQV